MCNNCGSIRVNKRVRTNTWHCFGCNQNVTVTELIDVHGMEESGVQSKIARLRERRVRI